MLSCYRTSLAKGRTGLAFLRTGISFIAISLVLFRVFGVGYLTIVEGLLFAIGVMMTIDGMKWYQPSRRVGKKPLECASTEPTGGTSVLEVSSPGDQPVFTRSAEVPGADTLRQGWSTLSPVMRRRCLGDRTDFAEERQSSRVPELSWRRRVQGSFTRTGIAFISSVFAMLRQFPDGSAWIAVYARLS
jgi:hypothetical protein